MTEDLDAISGSREPSPASGLDPSGFDPERFKPSQAFLAKVQRGEVKRVRGYTRRKGGYERFLGGEVQYKRHQMAGYVTRAPAPQLGLPGRVELTDKGRAALGKEQDQ